MSTELTVALDSGKSMAELMGVSNSSNTSAYPKVTRLYVNQEVIEKAVDVDGETLIKPIIPKGAYKLAIDDTVVYSKTATIRVFAIRNQWQHWNDSTKQMEKSVLSNSLTGDLKDNMGGFNLGRPNRYFSKEEYAELSDAIKNRMSEVSAVKVYFGTLTLDNPVDAEGNPTSEYVDIPFVFDVKNRESKKALDTVIGKISKKNLLPPQSTIKLSPGQGKIPTGATYGYVVADMGDRVDLTTEDNETFANFLEYIEYLNSYIIDKHNELRNNDMPQEDIELVASIVEVEE